MKDHSGRSGAADGVGRDTGTKVCSVCPRACRIAPGGRGFCGARGNVGGKIRCLNSGTLTALALDPVEKKPLACWKPGTFLLSAGSYGCNLRCPFCQNDRIAHVTAPPRKTTRMQPRDLVDLALELVPRGCVGIAHTYNEPFVSWEYLIAVAEIARPAGLSTVVVSNGMVEEGLLERLLPWIDAANIDLKGFTPGLYARCLGLDDPDDPLALRAFECVLSCIRRMAGQPGCHLEVSTLVLPKGQDAVSLEEGAAWLASVDPGIPYHVNQYHPACAWGAVEPVPDADVYAAAARARRHLERVFVGNLGRGPLPVA